MSRLASIATLAAIWIVFEALVSWAAFCQDQQDNASSGGGSEENHCILKGPVTSLVRSFLRVWSNIFHDADAYVALFTAVLAVFTLALWRSTRALWEAGERQIKTTRTVAAVQARHTQRQLKLAEDTAERQLRAYVSPIDGMVLDLDFDAPLQPFSIRIIFKNSGQTPAYEVASSSSVAFAAYPLVVVLEEIGNRTATTSIGPGADYRLTVKTIAITQPVWDALLAETAAFYIHGSYSYKDAFKRTRTGAFLYRYGGAGGLRVDRALTLYAEGNYTD
jgi:hypothetical protein